MPIRRLKWGKGSSSSRTQASSGYGRLHFLHGGTRAYPTGDGASSLVQMHHSGGYFLLAVLSVTADKLDIPMFSVPHSQSHSPWFSGNNDPTSVHTRAFSYDLGIFSPWDLDWAPSYNQPFSQGYFHAGQEHMLSQPLLLNSKIHSVD